MWIGLEFSDRDSFKKVLKKLAMYNNFNFKPLKSRAITVNAKVRRLGLSLANPCIDCKQWADFQTPNIQRKSYLFEANDGDGHRQAEKEIVAE